MKMMRIHATVFTMLCFIPLLVRGGGISPKVDETPAVLIRRLAQSEGISWPVRSQTELKLNYHYVAVRNEVMQILNTRKPASSGLIEDHSPLHCAILTASFWHIVEAEDRLLEFIDCQVDSSTLPPGIETGGSYFFPAADALVHIRANPNKLLTAISTQEESKIPLLVWVLVKTQGRDGALVLLKQKVIGKKYNESRLKAALMLLEGATDENDLFRVK